MSPLPDRMADHWWWRPGVRPGRRLLVWHILLDDQPEVRDLVRQCQDKLAGLDGLDLVPAEWLHLTTQIVGFADEIPQDEIDAMSSAAAELLAALDPIEVELGKVWFHSEAVMLMVRPPRALDPVRTAIRDAVASTVAVHQLADEPDWTPHVSLAYSNATGPAAPVVAALNVPPQPRPLTVNEVHLVAQERAGHLYRWDRLAPIGLGPVALRARAPVAPPSSKVMGPPVFELGSTAGSGRPRSASRAPTASLRDRLRRPSTHQQPPSRIRTGQPWACR